VEACKIYYCYKATNTKNQKVYIGFAADPEQRWRQHKADALNDRGYIFHQAIRKHGWDAFKFEVLCCGKNKREMLEYVEPALIEQYQSRIGEHGYNMHKKVFGASSRETDKRKSRSPVSEETRRKCSEAGKRRKMTDELRLKLSNALKGNPKLVGRTAHNKGKPMSEEQKRKQSIARKGLPFSTTVRASSFWMITFPDDRTQQIKSLNKFCRELGSSLRHVGNGKYQCNGFTAQKLSPVIIRSPRPHSSRPSMPKKLAAVQVEEIRSTQPYHGYKTALAKKYNVSIPAISYALTRHK
jgi:group I intron endonuclease